MESNRKRILKKFCHKGTYPSPHRNDEDRLKIHQKFVFDF